MLCDCKKMHHPSTDFMQLLFNLAPANAWTAIMNILTRHILASPYLAFYVLNLSTQPSHFLCQCRIQQMQENLLYKATNFQRSIIIHNFLTLGLNTTSVIPLPHMFILPKFYGDCMTLKYKIEVAITPITFRGTKCQETHFPLVWNSGTLKGRAYKYTSFFF